MDYCITSACLMGTTGAKENSIVRWMRDVPRRRVMSMNNRYYHMYRPDEVVVALRRRRHRGLAGDELRHFVQFFPATDYTAPLDAADARAAATLGVLTEEERDRFQRVRKWAAEGAAYSLWNRTHLIDLSRALDLLVLRSEVLAYVLTGQPSETFPTTREAWGGVMASHVVAVATPAELRNLANHNGAN